MIHRSSRKHRFYFTLAVFIYMYVYNRGMAPPICHLISWNHTLFNHLKCDWFFIIARVPGALRQIWFCLQTCFIRWIRLPKYPRDVDFHKWCVGLAMVSRLHIICFSRSLYWARHWPDELRTRVQSQFGLADLTVDGCCERGSTGHGLYLGYWIKSMFYLDAERWLNVPGKSYKWITIVKNYLCYQKYEVRELSLVKFPRTQSMCETPNSWSTFVLSSDVIILNRM